MNNFIDYWPQYVMLGFYITNMFYVIICGLFFGYITRNGILGIMLCLGIVETLHIGGFFKTIGW